MIAPFTMVALALTAVAGTTDVLFLGNSYTGTNDLPSMVRDLAASGGHAVTTTSYTPGGKTLGATIAPGGPHMTDPTSLGLIAGGGFEVVVLQEQSVIPTIPTTADQFMKPGVLSLHASIDAQNPGAVTLLYQTWARRDPGSWCWGSWCSPFFPDFDAMQDALTATYAAAAASIGGAVAPVGEAWRLYRHENPSGNLFQGDGSHPNVSGTYLAACTFYCALFDESPVGLPFTAGLSLTDAALLQDVAARTWFGATCGWSTYGSGTPTSLTLTGQGGAALGASATLSIAGASPGVTGWLLTSLAPASLPWMGSTLLVDPVQLLPILALPVADPWLSFTIPPAVSLTGLEVYFQALVPDSASGSGIAVSNGVRLEICP